jgi:hypothetical protein
MQQIQPETPMNHPGVIALRDIISLHVLIGSFKKLRIGSETSLMQPPVALFGHIWILRFVDLWILDKFAPQITINTAALYILNDTVFHGHFNPGIRPVMVVGTGEHAVHFDEHRSEPMLC